MRLNKFIALATGLARRKADDVIVARRVRLNDHVAQLGETVNESDVITLDGKPLSLASTTTPTTIMLNKPVGYVCSRDGQGSKTIYDLLPKDLHHLKPVGRLDKYSSGLLLLTNDGRLAHELTHPSFRKEKVYEIELDKRLESNDRAKIKSGMELEDGLSRLKLAGRGQRWTVRMTEGRNRQIRRTFAKLGYQVTKLHRTQFGGYKLSEVEVERYKQL